MVKILVKTKDLNVQIALKNSLSDKKPKIQDLLIFYIKDNKILSTLAKENNICIKTLKNYIKSLEIAKPTRLNLK